MKNFERIFGAIEFSAGAVILSIVLPLILFDMDFVIVKAGISVDEPDLLNFFQKSGMTMGGVILTGDGVRRMFS